MVKALARAHSWVARLLSGQASSIRAIAQAERLTGRYVARIIPLAFLAPDITEAILEGSQPQDLTLAKLCQRLPLAWPEQRRTLGFAAALEHHCVAPIARPRPARHGRACPPGHREPPMNANLRYWKSVVQAAEAELDAATTNSQLKLAARRLLRARQYLKTLTMKRPPPQAPNHPSGNQVTHGPATNSRHLPLAGLSGVQRS